MHRCCITGITGLPLQSACSRSSPGGFSAGCQQARVRESVFLPPVSLTSKPGLGSRDRTELQTWLRGGEPGFSPHLGPESCPAVLGQMEQGHRPTPTAGNSPVQAKCGGFWGTKVLAGEEERQSCDDPFPLSWFETGAKERECNFVLPLK